MNSVQLMLRECCKTHSVKEFIELANVEQVNEEAKLFREPKSYINVEN